MISVIIPIYNGARHLRQCIDSVLSQTCNDFEILLADDGSTDDSPLICKEYASLYGNIRYFRKENGGVSSTRNLGMDRCSGQFVMFLDCDDYLCNDCLLEKCAYVVNGNPLVLPVFNYKSLLPNGELRDQPPFIIKDPNRIDLMGNVISGTYQDTKLNGMFRAVWGKLFNKGILDEFGIRFKEDMYLGEDSVFVMEYVQHVESVQEITPYSLVYRTSDDSACRKYQKDYLSQLKLELDGLNKFASSSNSKLLNASMINFAFNSCYLLYCNDLKGGISKHISSKAFLRYAMKYLNFSCETAKLSKRCRLSMLIGRFFPIFFNPLMKIWYLRSTRKAKKNRGGWPHLAVSFDFAPRFGLPHLVEAM